jgi:hypothetical protein
MNDQRTSERKPGAEREAKRREGLSRRLDVIQQETAEIREQLRALTELLGVQLIQHPDPR